MNGTEKQENASFLEQIQLLLKDGVDYLALSLEVAQARMVAVALSAALVVLLLGAGSLLGLAAFVMLNVAAGVWLAHATGSVLASVLILSACYGILSAGCLFAFVRWMRRLQS